MDDSDLADLSNETLAQQYEKIKRETTKSHVKRFGSQNVEEEIVGNFQSIDDTPVRESTWNNVENELVLVTSVQNLKTMSAVKAYDVELIGKFYQYLRSDSMPDRSRSADDLMDDLRKRMLADQVFGRLHALTKYPVDEGQFLDSSLECYEKGLNMFEAKCIGLGTTELGGAFTSYSLMYTETFAALCASHKNHSADVERKVEMFAQLSRTGKPMEQPNLETST
uniref:Vacuolarprocessing enzyme putative n=1 Tax=Albugo laibachii Nc14 TaxID=890382 RepID=F0WVL3_9STRA|nr:vacuolarprocessing enzyme putative [Albugo laibachii Nc14]|eukprot:CCA25455.1 vacuolarprocessing enzyme putative [Albugo laibachii Nc14]